MSFHDEIHRISEEWAYKSARDLLLWLRTISPYSGVECIQLENALLDLAEYQGWEVFDDPTIGMMIK